MKIIFDKLAGRNLDMIWSLYYMANYEHVRKEIRDNDTGIDEEIEAILQNLFDSDIDKSRVGFYFNSETRIFDALIGMEELFGKTLEEILTSIKKMPEDEVVYRLIREHLSDKYEDNTALQQETQRVIDRYSFTDFIKTLDISDGAKWCLYCFSENIRNNLAEAADLINEYSSIYNREMDRHSKKREGLDKEIENRINKENVSFLGELLRGSIDFSQYDEIHISAALLHYHSLYFYSRKNKGFMYIGCKYEGFMGKLEGENEIERNLNIFKNLSDRTRYEILKLLLKRDYFGQEIAQELNITTATVSYHMNYLAAVRLVEITRKDHKAYYRLNKETIRACTNFLNREFEMNK